MSKTSVYDIITEKIIEQLEKGVIPWKKTWTSAMPKNLVSGKEYRGVNVLLLAIQAFSSPFFATAKQINQLGGHIKKGSKGTPVVYFKFIDKDRDGNVIEDADEATDDMRSVPIIRYYRVFNVEQCEGLEGKIPQQNLSEFNPIEECEKVVAGYLDAPAIIHAGGRPCYRPLPDEVMIPHPENFDRAESYYDTLFHELVHSTGHEKRLKRPGVVNTAMFGSHPYSKEELVAEIGACFLASRTGIDIRSSFNNQVAYISSWLKSLENDKRLIVQAAAQAQKAVDHMLGVTYGEKAEKELAVV